MSGLWAYTVLSHILVTMRHTRGFETERVICVGPDITDSFYFFSCLAYFVHLIEVLFLLQVHEVEIHSNAENCKDWVSEALDNIMAILDQFCILFLVYNVHRHLIWLDLVR